MVNPATYRLYTPAGERLIDIDPVYEEIAGGDLFPTGRYLISEASGGKGEIRFDGDLIEWEWSGSGAMEDNCIEHIIRFIEEYNEPELAGYLE